MFSESDFISSDICKPLSDDMYRKELELILSYDEALLKSMDSYIGMMQLSHIWYVSGCRLGSSVVPDQFSMFEDSNWLPVMYCFRHALELAFKAYLFSYRDCKKNYNTHSLKVLYDQGVGELFADYFNLCCGSRGSDADIKRFVNYFSDMEKGEKKENKQEDAYRYYLNGTNKFMKCNLDVFYVQRIIDYMLQIIEIYVLFDVFNNNHNVFPALCFQHQSMHDGVEFYQILNQGIGYGSSDEIDKCVFQILFGCDRDLIDAKYNEN